MEARMKSFLTHPSVMADRIRAYDWRQTPIGPIESWPQWLKTNVETLLANRFPMILLRGTDLIVCAYNDAYRPLLADKFEALGRPYLTIWPEVADIVRPQLQQALRGKAFFCVEAPFSLSRHGKMEQVYYDYCFSPVRDEHGGVGGILGTTVETTEQVNSRRMLQENVERFRNLYDQTPLGYQSLDAEGRFLEVNKAWLDMMGYSRSEVIGRRFGDFLAPGEFGAFKQRFPKFIARGEVHADVRMVKGDGTRITVHIDGRIGLDEQGRFKQTHCILHDVTEQKKNEESLRCSEENLRIAQKIASIGNWSWDIATGRVKWSDQVYEIFKAPPDEPSYEFAKSFVHPEDVKLWTETIERAVEDQAPFTASYRAVRTDGNVIWVHNETEPLFDENGTLIGYRGTVQDVTARKLMEEELKAERFKLKEYFENLPVMAYNVRFDGIIEDLNTTAVKALGFDHKAELIGKPLISTVYAPSCREKAVALFEKWKHEKQIENEEMQIVTRHGQIVDVLLNVDTIFDHNGKPIHSLSTHLDISKVKKAEEALRQSEEKFRHIAEYSLVGIYVLQEGYFTYVNPKFAEIFGYTVGECLDGMHFRQLVHPGDLSTVQEQIRRRVSRETDSVHYTFRGVKKSGQMIHVEIFGSSMLMNETVAATGMMLDVTERRQTEEAMLESESRYSALFTGITDAVYVHLISEDGSPGEIIDVNDVACNMLGYTKDELIGMEINKIDAPESTVDVHYVVENLKAGRSVLFEQVHVTKNGTRIPVEVHTQTFEYRGSLAILSTVRDIRDRKLAEREKKQLERQLLQSRKMESIGTLAGGIAHDFNNILASMIGFTELALDEAQTGTTLEEHLQEVYAGGKRARSLVKQILAFARRSDEKLSLIQPSPIAKEVLKFMRHSIPTSIEIVSRIESESVIMGNAIQLHQVLMNLCTNAAHAMEDAGGRLTVSLRDVSSGSRDTFRAISLKPGDYIEIRVSDTGAGIAPEILDSIFEPYFTTKGPGEGTGMGLAVAHGIVESYGGKMTVDSLPGKGATFSIYLPVTRRRKADGPYDAVALPSGTESILFVDDEAAITKMNSQILERLGYSVTTCNSSAEALELFRSKPHDFDLVITDMTMPNMTGDQLAIEMMKIRKDIPVILCTGYSRKVSDHTASQVGIRALAYKPMVKADLARMVRKVLDDARIPK